METSFRISISLLIINSFNIYLQLVKRVEVGERTIENLQQEITLMQRSDALERARQQHDDVIGALNEQHEGQLLEVTTMLDQVRRVADEKVRVN